MVHQDSLVMMVARVLIVSTLAPARRVTEFWIEESIGGDTPIAKYTVASLGTDTTGESYGGHCEVCEDVDEEELNAHCMYQM